MCKCQRQPRLVAVRCMALLSGGCRSPECCRAPASMCYVLPNVRQATSYYRPVWCLPLPNRPASVAICCCLMPGLFGDFENEVLRMQYSSLTTPHSTYDQHLHTGNRALKKMTPVLGGFSRDNYLTQRLWATAADGVSVPISVVFRKGFVKLDGSDPMLLHG